MKNFQSKSAEIFLIKVWLQKVNQISLDIFSQPATITFLAFCIFQSKFAGKFSIEVC